MARNPRQLKLTKDGTLPPRPNAGPQIPTPDIAARIEKLLLAGVDRTHALYSLAIGDYTFRRWCREARRGTEPFATVYDMWVQAEHLGLISLFEQARTNSNISRLLAAKAASTYSQESVKERVTRQAAAAPDENRHVLEVPSSMSEKQWTELFRKSQEVDTGKK